MAEYLDYKLIFWLVFGSLVLPIYLVACVLSAIKAYYDRKAVKARLQARKSATVVAPTSPVDIIAQEVRDNKWHKRQSTVTFKRLQSLLKVHNTSNNRSDGVDISGCNKNLQDVGESSLSRRNVNNDKKNVD